MINRLDLDIGYVMYPTNGTTYDFNRITYGEITEEDIEQHGKKNRDDMDTDKLCFSQMLTWERFLDDQSKSAGNSSQISDM